MTLREEIDHYLKQGFRELSLALRAESDTAKRCHLEMAIHYSEIVQRLRTQLQLEEQANVIDVGIWA
jgi:hypothetical protein